jgi:hypothetical protein
LVQAHPAQWRCYGPCPSTAALISLAAKQGEVLYIALSDFSGVFYFKNYSSFEKMFEFENCSNPKKCSDKKMFEFENFHYGFLWFF